MQIDAPLIAVPFVNHEFSLEWMSLPTDNLVLMVVATDPKPPQWDKK